MTTDPAVTEEHRARVEVRVREVAEIVQRVRASKYIPWEPTAKQWDYLCDAHLEVMTGGSSGPGKSVSIMMDALAHVHQPYNALILRRTFRELAQPDGLMSLAAEWLGPTDALATDGMKRWTFPSGAMITFGHVESENDKYNYASSQFQRVYYDELTSFTETQYEFLFTRLRRPKRRLSVPLAMRSATNPVGPGLDWVRARFVDPFDDPDRNFIPALPIDNPHLDWETYELSLSKLDPVLRAQMQHGDWYIQPAGNFFKTGMFRRIGWDDPHGPWGTDDVLRCRSWDTAATQDGGDWTVGVRVAYSRALMRYRIEDVVRGRWAPDELEAVVAQTAAGDPESTVIALEQEPGSSGKLAVRDMRRRVLAGRDVRVTRPTGPKIERARLFASLLANGDVDLVVAAWNQAFVSELASFPAGSHDDATDAASQGFHELARMIGATSEADTSAVDTFRRMSVVTSDAARNGTPGRAAMGAIYGEPTSSPFGNGGGFRR